MSNKNETKNTAILYLRHNKNTPDKMQIEICVPGATCSYTVPVMKVQSYTIETIFEKKLFFLIPFHLFTYEKDFRVYEENPQRLSELTSVYEEIAEKLNLYEKNQEIDSYTKSMIVDMSKKVLEHLAMKYSKVKKGVSDIMGGKILEYPTKTAWRQAVQQGMQQGLQQRTREIALELLQESASMNLISKVTKLSLEEVEELARTML